MLLEKQGSTTTATYTYGNGLIRKDGETPLFDGLGSERTVTNSSQTVTGTATYEGFGQTVATTGSSTDPYMFAATSKYRNDGDAGLMHVGARYYDAQVGRFITRDTYLNQKPYLYCEHDPINQLDPSGHIGGGLLVDLAGSATGPIGGGGVAGTLGGILEGWTPPHTILHGIGGTLAGGGTILVGLGIVAAAGTSVAAAPVVVAGGLIIGTGLAVAGLYHAIAAWF